jgi:hypothetical protein
MYAHHSYVKSRRFLHSFPLQQPLAQNDIQFQELKKNKILSDPRKARDRSWISKKTWNLIDARINAVPWKYPRERIQEYSKAI